MWSLLFIDKIKFWMIQNVCLNEINFIKVYTFFHWIHLWQALKIVNTYNGQPKTQLKKSSVDVLCYNFSLKTTYRSLHANILNPDLALRILIFFIFNWTEHEIYPTHNVKMPITDGILTFFSRINTTYESFNAKLYLYFSILAFMSNLNFMLNWVEHDTDFMTLKPDCSII